MKGFVELSGEHLSNPGGGNEQVMHNADYVAKVDGEWVKCPSCYGGGIRTTAYGYPEPCSTCEGNKRLWKYPKGSLVLHPGGPFV